MIAFDLRMRPDFAFERKAGGSYYDDRQTRGAGSTPTIPAMADELRK
ncbi:hypothetical protein [Paraburkholderia tuberum]|nr:hypothetical protein [Paraburkholderia tuberum]